MPEGDKKTHPKIAEEPVQMGETGFRAFLAKLRKRRIIETLAAFIGGGWLLVEVVERLLVSHYRFPEETIDITVVSIVGALLCTLIWRWFRSTEKRPGNVKVEVLLVPLIILVALAIDLNLIFQIAGIPGKKLLIGIIALCIGIAWIIFKLYQWAARTPDAAVKKYDILKLAEIKPEKSIVVLPFADLSPQKDQEYFCDGMTEEIITDLSHVRELLVISRNSAMTFKGTQKTTKTIAGELNVQYVLEGSVRKAGNDLRIAAQLINADTDVHIWAEKYSGTLDDVFDIQDKVSCAIVAALKVKLAPDEEHRIADRPLTNVHAYDAYLRALQDIWRWTEAALERARLHLQNALEIVGDNALLYVGLGTVYANYWHAAIRMDEETLLKAEEFAGKALRLEPDLAQGYGLLASVAIARGQMKQSFRHAQRGLTINPSDPYALNFLIYSSFPLGKTSSLAAHAERFVKIDPLSFYAYLCLGFISWAQGRLDVTLGHYRTAYRLDPETPITRWWLAWGLVANRLFEEAEALLIPWSKEAPGNIMPMSNLFLLHAVRGERAQALQSVTEEWRSVAWQDYWVPIMMAEGYALIGEVEEALRWLEHAADKGWINYPFLSEKDPWLANIRGEPRFKKLMERVKYEWEHFEV
jgi:non-specific serine/threonine protein kinase